MHGRNFTAFGPPEKIYDARPWPPMRTKSRLSRDSLILMDPERGHFNAKELLKADPSNPAVIPNLSVIADTNFLNECLSLERLVESLLIPECENESVLLVRPNQSR
jgi:hypothetical protein